MTRNEQTGELKFFLTYLEERASLALLTDAQKGRLYQAKFNYFFDAEEPDFSDDPALSVLWSLIGPKLEKNRLEGFKKSIQSAYRTYQRDFLPDDDHPDPLTIGQWLAWKKRLYEQTGLATPSAYKIITPEDL